MKYLSNTQHGFTLIETLVGIFILALTIGALLTLTAGGFFSIRYAKNDIVANNLLQESLEYIRNTRDTAAQQNIGWDDWMLQYKNSTCFSANGCTINPYATQAAGDFVADCVGSGTQSECEELSYYKDAGMYAYQKLSRAFDDTSTPIPTTFVRWVTFEEFMTPQGHPQVLVTSHIDWMNGVNPKHLTQSMLLTSWRMTQ